MHGKKFTLSLLLSVLFVSPAAISATYAHSHGGHGGHARPVSYTAQKPVPPTRVNNPTAKLNCNLGDTHNCR